MNMYPSCDTVEYASTFLMSHCLSPIDAAKIAVSAPMTTTVRLATGDSEKRKLLRAMRYTPAVTIVAAWISADTGVGPAIASGNHVYRGICALFPVHPRKKKRQIQVTTPGPRAVACARTPSNSSVP